MQNTMVGDLVQSRYKKLTRRRDQAIVHTNQLKQSEHIQRLNIILDRTCREANDVGTSGEKEGRTNVNQLVTAQNKHLCTKQVQQHLQHVRTAGAWSLVKPAILVYRSCILARGASCRFDASIHERMAQTNKMIPNRKTSARPPNC